MVKCKKTQNKCEIKIRVFSSYSSSEKPWYVTKEKMTKKEFNKYVKDWKVKEFEDNDMWRTGTDKAYSWDDGYINTLHD